MTFTYLDALQWIGFVMIVIGYWRMPKSIRHGTWLTLAGCAVLLAWAYIVGAWGVAALEAALILVSIKTLWRQS